MLLKIPNEMKRSTGLPVSRVRINIPSSTAGRKTKLEFVDYLTHITASVASGNIKKLANIILIFNTIKFYNFNKVSMQIMCNNI